MHQTQGLSLVTQRALALVAWSYIVTYSQLYPKTTQVVAFDILQHQTVFLFVALLLASAAHVLVTANQFSVP